jgi:hypothetical protein
MTMRKRNIAGTVAILYIFGLIIIGINIGAVRTYVPSAAQPDSGPVVVTSAPLSHPEK